MRDNSGPSAVCGACGAALSRDARFCGACGARVDCSTPPESDADTETGSVRRVPKPEHARRELRDPRTWDPSVTADEEDGGTVVIECGSPDVPTAHDEPRREPALVASLRIGNVRSVIALLSEKDRFIIGRDRVRCDATVSDPLASRTHAAIGVKKGTAFIEDVGTTNGTFVNGDRIIDARELRDLDTIRVGRTDMVFRRT